MRRILGIFLLVAIVVGGYIWYKRYAAEKQLADGDIQCVGCMSPERKAEFLKENAGEDADGQSEHKTTRGNISAGGTATTGTSASTTEQTGTIVTGATATPTSTTNTAPAQNKIVYPSPATSGSTMTATAVAAGLPLTDTVAPNPTNGMTFGGKGTYQWYRQGNLTWRVDTVTGRSCIVFATEEEWRKQIVLSHGCGGNA